MNSKKIKTYKSIQKQKQKRLKQWIENNERVKKAYEHKQLVTGKKHFTLFELVKSALVIK